MSTTLSTPGWYPDPAGGPGLQHWDGWNWTAQFRLPQGQPTSIGKLLAAIAGIPLTILFGGLAAVSVSQAAVMRPLVQRCSA